MRTGDRDAALARLAGDEQFDLIVVGGGITGAGILREATRRGIGAVLLEQRDFAWGTSSRSSKMVHGGLRYLGQGQVGLARKAVDERERLIAEAPGLVERIDYLYPVRRGKFPGRFAFGAVLVAYDVLGRARRHRFLGREQLAARAPGIVPEGLRGAYVYSDGATDDARLVQRVLGEAVADGAMVVNYAPVTELLREQGRVCGVRYEDAAAGDGAVRELRARAVIDASGAWADRLEPRAFGELRIRPLRGSHLVLAQGALDIADTIIFMHPADGRPVFAYPWLGRMVVGTTDLDHDGDLDVEARISPDEVDYLTDAVERQFGVSVNAGDVISTLSGVRPVLSSGNAKRPSKERRDEAVWAGDGVVCASGGKLTTFRLTARQALKAAAPLLGDAGRAEAADDGAVFAHPAPASIAANLPPDRRRQLAGRFGAGLVEYAQLPGWDAPPVDGTPFALAELRYAARNEMVVHLDDLLLRRTRLGNLLPGGAAALFADVEAICREELDWDDERWNAERTRYEQLWRDHYGPPQP